MTTLFDTDISKDFVERSAVDIQIYRNDLSQDDLQAITQSVEKYAQQLLTGLDLPTTAVAFVSNENNARESYGIPFSLRINHLDGRVSPVKTAVAELVADEISNLICDAICVNRELFVTPVISDIVQRILLEDGYENFQEVTGNDFQQRLIKLVANGYSTNRCRCNSLTSQDSAATDMAFFEAVTSAINCPKVVVRLSEDYLNLIRHATSAQEGITEMLTMMQDGLFWELGIALPMAQMEIETSLTGSEIQIQINDLILPITKGLKSDTVLVNDTVTRLTLLNVKGEEALNPANGTECAVINVSDADICEQAGLTTWSESGYLVLLLASVLRQYAGSLLTHDLVSNNLDSLSIAFPVLVDTVRRRYDDATITSILRCLLDEQISIRDLRALLDGMLLVHGTVDVDLSSYIVFIADGTFVVPTKQKDLSALAPEELSDYLRSACMRRTISHKYTRGGNTLVVYLIDPVIEERLRQQAELDQNERAMLVQAVSEELKSLPMTAQSPVLLTTYELRRRLHKEIGFEFPQLAVLCYQELSLDMNIQPIARISAAVKSYDENFFGLLEAMPPLVIKWPKREIESSRHKDKDNVRILDVLDRQAMMFCEKLIEHLESRHPIPQLPVLKEALNLLVRSVFNAFVNLVATGTTETLDHVYQKLHDSLGERKVPLSIVYEILLKISQLIRRRLASEISESAEKTSIDSLNKVLDQIDESACQATRRLLDISIFEV